MAVNPNTEIGTNKGESPQKPTIYKQARRKYDRAESVLEKGLKREIEKLHTKIRHLEQKHAENKDRLTVCRAKLDSALTKLCVYQGNEKGRPRTKPDPTLVKLSEAERLIALRVVHQYRQAASKELYLTKLKFAIGIDPLTDFAAPDSKGGA